VLTTGVHFVAARRLIQASYPRTCVVGLFIVRRVLAQWTAGQG